MLGLDKRNSNLLSFSIVPLLEPLIIKHKTNEKIGCGAQPFIVYTLMELLSPYYIKTCHQYSIMSNIKSFDKVL